MKIITREYAMANGLSRYFTGVPCANGHVDLRHTCNKTCVTCRRNAAKAWRTENRDRNLRRIREWRRANKERLNAVDRKWARANPEKVRNRTLRHRYGVDHQWVLSQIEIQGGRCPICSRNFEQKQGLAPNVDHDHVTGKVRGVICGSCNTAAGLLRDDPLVAQSMARYLRKHK